MRVNVRALSIVVLAGLAADAALRATFPADHPGADEVWSTKKVMDKVHVGKQSLLSVVSKDLGGVEPEWKRDEDNLTEIIRLMCTLTKQKPLRGSQENWNKLVQDYVEGAKAARQSVKKHKLPPARAALEKMRSTCEECHDNHGIK
jgi:hypothetical protein